MVQRVQIKPERSFQTPVNGELFTDAAATFTSAVIPTDGINKMLLMLDCDVTGTVTSLDIYVQFAQTNLAAEFHTYESGPYGSLRVATASTDFCIKGEILADYMRINVVSAGCSATAFYSLTVDVILQK